MARERTVLRLPYRQAEHAYTGGSEGYSQGFSVAIGTT